MQITNNILAALAAIPQLNIANTFGDLHLLANGVHVTENEEGVCFSDTFGNYVWIEQGANSKISIDTISAIGYACSNTYKVMHTFSLFFVGQYFVPEKVCNFIASVIAAQSKEITLTSYSFSFQDIIINKMKGLSEDLINKTLDRFCEHAIVKIDYTYAEIIGAYVAGCPIDICEPC
jgi:hypothetical protein